MNVNGDFLVCVSLKRLYVEQLMEGENEMQGLFFSIFKIY